MEGKNCGKYSFLDSLYFAQNFLFWSEQVFEVEFAMHYKDKEIASGSRNESLPIE